MRSCRTCWPKRPRRRLNGKRRWTRRQGSLNPHVLGGPANRDRTGIANDENIHPVKSPALEGKTERIEPLQPHESARHLAGIANLRRIVSGVNADLIKDLAQKRGGQNNLERTFPMSRTIRPIQPVRNLSQSKKLLDASNLRSSQSKIAKSLRR